MPEKRGRSAERGDGPGPPPATGAILISENYSAPADHGRGSRILPQRKPGENGYMFINSETNRMAGVFRNPLGGISLIEPSL
ncbi:MAG: hypothetical protein MZV63_33625 [Marinilabiliales bacterium]|nr:hypothetical protein [Marinilabiliales bacterium]